MPPRKKQKKVKFELTAMGIAGIGVVFFCIFLWMFLLGVWAGQTILLPSTEDGSVEAMPLQAPVPPAK